MDTGEPVERILPTLREYQTRAVTETRLSITPDCKRIVLVSPTGSGKSVILSEIIRLALEKGNTVLWLVHRRNLVYQMRDTLRNFGIEPGIIMAGEESDTLQKVQIGTYQTYQRRLQFEDGKFFIDASLVLIDECLTPDTEILTENGWMLIDGLDKEIKVAEYWQETGDIDFVVPKKHISKQYFGNIINITGRHTDISMTPEHEQPYTIMTTFNRRKQSAKDWKVSGNHLIPIAGYAVGDSKLTDYERLLIAASADGCFVDTSNKNHQIVQFHFSKTKKINRILSLIESAGLKYVETKPAARKGNVKPRRRFSLYFPPNTKKGLSEIRKLSSVSALWGKQFIDELVKWDGYTKGILYWSGTSKDDADYIQAVCALSGITCNRNIQIDRRKESYKDVHRITFSDSEYRGCQSTVKRTEPYSGKVVCVRVDSGNIIIRRNGKVSITGNCHRSLSEGYTGIIDRYAGKVLIGCTATPVRADNRPMGSIYDKIVDVISVSELMENGFLAQARYFASPIDLEGIKIVRGDYETKQLEKKTNTKKLVGDVVQNWLRIAKDRPTIVFCVTVKHSIHICEEFNKNGVPALHLDAKSTDEEREDAFRQMENGDITVLCNVALYQEGMDCPNISCVVMARPTKSLGLYRQCCGRGLRPKDNGGDCVIIDHGGCIEEHGLLTDEVEWTLEGKEKAWKKKEPKEKKKAMCKCPTCQAVFEGLKQCPDCGSELKTFGTKIDVVDAELQEIGKKKSYSMADKRRFYGMLKHWVPRQKNSNPNRVAGAYRGKFGVWPRGMDNVAPIEPDIAFLNYMKSQVIRFAKSRKAEARI